MKLPEKDALRFPPMRAWRLFEAIYEKGSLAAAADSLSIELSAASRLMKSLELYVGTPLLDRRKRPVEPTSAADRLHPHAAALLQAAAALEDCLSELREPLPRKRFRLSMPATFADGAQPSRIHAYEEAHPGISFELFTFRDEFDALAGTVDAAYIPYWPQPIENIKSIPVFRSGTCLLAAPSYLAAHPRLESVEDLVHHKLLRRTGRGYPVTRFLFSGSEAYDLESGERSSISEALRRSHPAGQKARQQLEGIKALKALPAAQLGPYPSGVRILSGDALSCLQSARAGEGIAVDLSLRFVEDDLRSQRLLPVLPPWRPALWTNTLAVRAEAAEDPDFLAFVKWFVKTEAEPGLARWRCWRNVFGEDASLAQRRGF